MTPAAVFAVLSAVALFGLFYRWLGWKGTMLFTLPGWLILNLIAAALLA